MFLFWMFLFFMARNIEFFYNNNKKKNLPSIGSFFTNCGVFDNLKERYSFSECVVIINKHILLVWGMNINRWCDERSSRLTDEAF